MHRILITTLLLASAQVAQARDWNSNPNNWANSQGNWANNSGNWANNPSNWANNPSNQYGGNRVYGSDGSQQGYAVPRGDGGTNYFDFSGNRRGYSPGR